MNTFIYSLVDPRSNAIKYIGKANDPQRRLRWHILKPCSRAMSKWIYELSKDGLVPIINEIEECQIEEWQDREKFWIAKHREDGEALLNLMNGGNGESVFSERVKISHSASMSIMRSDPEYRRRHILGMKEMRERPGFWDKHQAAIDRRSKNPEWRKKHYAFLEKQNSDPAIKMAQSNRCRAMFNDEDFIKRRLEGAAKRRRPLIQIDKDTLLVIGRFECGMDAEFKTGVSRKLISQAARGIYKSAGGFRWAFSKRISFRRFVVDNY